jgi:hypothetical protein
MMLLKKSFVKSLVFGQTYTRIFAKKASGSAMRLRAQLLRLLLPQPELEVQAAACAARL